MEDEIDAQGIINQLIEENEQLRIHAAKLYAKHAPSLGKAVEYVQDHYIFFIVAGLWLALLISFIDAIRERREDDA